MIKFIDDVVKSKLVFKDVSENQFFINNQGHLCQKRDFTSFNVIAYSNGDPYSRSVIEVEKDTPIKKILNVSKIEFE